MPGNLRFTAAKSSTINKKSVLPSSLKNLLPSSAKYQQNLKKKQKQSLAASPAIDEKKKSKVEEPLTVLDYNVQLDYQLSSNEDILTAIDTILETQWSESCTLHNRFHDKELKKSGDMEQLLFSLTGLSMATKAEIMKYRTTQLPHGLVTVNQLYSIFEKQGHTFVDRSLELKIRQGKLKKFIITNASPIISRSPQKFQKGKVTYGYENVEVVVKLDNYLEQIESKIKDIEGDLNGTECLVKFSTYVKENPTSLFIGLDEFTKDDINKLVTFGYITLTSNHLNEIESHQYALAYPTCGTYLKLINAGRAWLVKLLSKAKYKEILEDQLFDKWEGISTTKNNHGLDTQFTSKMNNFRKPYYGFELYWILADALGAGMVEVFRTPVGRGWRLTGKM